jgi:DNA-binding CsgD family transcriptional regulator/outer membrane lipoprotein-sorting protein
MSEQFERFQFARSNESLLSERQRAVLALLVAGKTNAEIGDRLGITLDGAKWNVSEILTKLGLASREDAAAYWRWRSRPAARLNALRGLVGIGSLKWVGGGAALVLGVAVVAAILGRNESAAGAPFYLEARVQVVDTSRTVGTNVAGAQLTPEKRVSVVRWWNLDVNHARWEFEQLEGEVSGARVNQVVADGAYQWVYRSDTNSYTQTALPPLPEGWTVRPIASSLLLGPGLAKSKTELLAMLRDWSGPNGTVREIGAETVLGRRTTIIEMTPASRGARSDANGNEIDTSSGVARIWLDEDRMMVLRYVTEGTDQSINAEVTELQYGKRPAANEITFAPPPDSVLVTGESGVDGTDSGGSQSSAVPDGQTVQFPEVAGFFRAGWLPDGFTTTSYDIQRRPDGSAWKYELGFRSDRQTQFSLTQTIRPGGVAPEYRRGERLDIAGSAAWVQTEQPAGAPDHTVLATTGGGLMLVLESTGLPAEALIHVIESLEPMQ